MKHTQELVASGADIVVAVAELILENQAPIAADGVRQVKAEMALFAKKSGIDVVELAIATLMATVGEHIPEARAAVANVIPIYKEGERGQA